MNFGTTTWLESLQGFEVRGQESGHRNMAGLGRLTLLMGENCTGKTRFLKEAQRQMQNRGGTDPDPHFCRKLPAPFSLDQFEMQGSAVGDLETVLTRLRRKRPQAWREVKRNLEAFGKESGIFDRLEVGAKGVKIRKRIANGWRNRLIRDSGKAVRRTIELICELCIRSEPTVFLLENPEEGLSNRACAALASMLAKHAKTEEVEREGEDRVIVVETHSQTMLNRICMDIRDSQSPLRWKDLRILYFQTDGGREDSRITQIHMDEDGEPELVPPRYREFEEREQDRVLQI